MTNLYKLNPGLLKELIHYKTAEAGYRELIANALDQYEHDDCKDKVKEVIITIRRLAAIVEGKDGATGVEKGKEDEFMEIGTRTVSDDSGKIVGSRVSSYAHIDPDIVGQKHVGKLSLLGMTKGKTEGKVEFYSNNGTNGKIFTMNGLYSWDEETVDTVKALSHIGLNAKIYDVEDSCLKAKHVAEEISSWFGIRIARGAKIKIRDIDNGKEFYVEPPADLDTHEFTEKKESGFMWMGNIPITYHLIPANNMKEAGIDVYQKHIKVKRIQVGRLVKGWVNCDALRLTLFRDDYVTDAEFDTKLEAFLIKEGYQKEEEPKSQPMKNQKQIEEIVGDIFQAYQQEYKNEIVNLFGTLDPLSTIKGKVTKNESGDTDWEYYKDNQKIVPEAGDPEGDEITTKGNKHKKRKGPKITTPPVPPTESGPGPSVEDGGTRTAYVKKRIQTEQIEGNVKPRVPMWTLGRTSEMPTLFIEDNMEKGRIVVLNSDRPAHWSIKHSAGPKQNEILLPHLVRAVVRYQTKDTDISIEEYERRCDNMFNQMYDTLRK